jgi:DNA-binding transcriptional LysR family regulator
MEYSVRELECFLAVAEELSFTRAAKRLHLAQPPLSRHIRTLEEKIGAQLILRQPRQVTLTVAGRLFYDETRHLPRLMARAGDAARRCALGETLRLQIGFVSAVMNDELVDVVRRFRAGQPEVQLMLHDSSPQDQLRAIAAGRLDGGFIGIAPDVTPAGIQLLGWHEEPLRCFVPSHHPLAKTRTVSLSALAKESFIAVSHDSAPAFAAYVRRLCRSAGFLPRIILESPRAQAVALMVAAGSGIALLPAALARFMQTSLAVLPIRESPKIRHVFAHPKGSQDKALVQWIKQLPRLKR